MPRPLEHGPDGRRESVGSHRFDWTAADFVALYLARTWLGEHRASMSRLYQRIREVRGMNSRSQSATA